MITDVKSGKLLLFHSKIFRVSVVGVALFCDFRIVGRGHACYILEGREKGGPSLEADTVTNSLKGHIAIVLKVIDAPAGFLNPVFIDINIKIAVVGFIDDLRDLLVLGVDQFGQLLQVEFSGIDLLASLHDRFDLVQQRLLVCSVQVAVLIRTGIRHRLRLLAHGRDFLIQGQVPFLQCPILAV